MNCAIWWIRRDLRLADNAALRAAVSQARMVVPTFVLDPYLLGKDDVAPARLGFLLDGLRRLDNALRLRGSRLVVRYGDPVQELPILAKECHAEAIFAEEDYTPYARRRDASVATSVPLRLFPGVCLQHPQAVLKADGTPYTVFTPYSRAWLRQVSSMNTFVWPAPSTLVSPPDIVSVSVPVNPSMPALFNFQAGEDEALRQLRAFTEGDDPPIYHYASSRDNLAIEGTSRLSPFFRFGMVSIRQAFVAAQEAGRRARSSEAIQGVEAWVNELIWRDFYYAILYHFPDVLRRSFRPQMEHIIWANDEGEFMDWCAGRTGFPIVDAAMRQLRQMGWMHNRARMIVASFLVKDLLIDWRWGEKWFMQNLADGDPAANNGGWQWSAGTGTDAAPYFRIFHPVIQGRRYDPGGVFVRRWVSELSRVPAQYIHEPWKMPLEVQKQVGCFIGHEYPAPIIDHAWARRRALTAYAVAKSSVSLEEAKKRQRLLNSA